ncbi:MAG: NAD-dependent deacylase [Chloroflexi bacterium]|nr:NAD-dependent deacylase [Chloroflexota bacterium]
MTNIDDQLATAARIISESSYLIALVGAGMSKESGIPTFRGGDGLWDKHGEPPMDGYQRMLADPAAWWAERQAQRQSQAGDELTRAIEEAKPNPGHIALAEMERRGYLKHIITQNIDNLHQEAGSTAITEIHGNRTKMRCIDCVRRWGRDEFVLTDSLPRCPDCEGLVKSDTVMFGEPIPQDALDSCFREAKRADAVLLLGTSAAVYPAAEFPVIVYRNGGKLIEVNPQETPLSELCSAVLRAPSGEALPALLEQVSKLATGG